MDATIANHVIQCGGRWLQASPHLANVVVQWATGPELAQPANRTDSVAARQAGSASFKRSSTLLPPRQKSSAPDSCTCCVATPYGVDPQQ